MTTTELSSHPLAFRPLRIKPDDPQFVLCQGVWRSFRFETTAGRFTDRALVVWNAGKQLLDEQKRKTHLKRLLNPLSAIQSKLNTRRSMSSNAWKASSTAVRPKAWSMWPWKGPTKPSN